MRPKNPSNKDELREKLTSGSGGEESFFEVLVLRFSMVKRVTSRLNGMDWSLLCDEERLYHGLGEMTGDDELAGLSVDGTSNGLVGESNGGLVTVDSRFDLKIPRSNFRVSVL